MGWATANAAPNSVLVPNGACCTCLIGNLANRGGVIKDRYLTISQAFDGMHDGMLPTDALSQPLDGGQSSTWMSSQGQSYPTRFGPPLFIQTQQQSPIHGGGLPSPTPTAAAASPTEWGDRAMSSVDGSWPTMSPAGPAVRQRRSSGFEHLNTLLYAPSTTSATGDTGLHGCWPSDAGFPINFSHPYSGVPTSPHGVSGDFSTAWSAAAETMSVSSLPPANEQFMETAYSQGFSGNPAEAPVSVPPPSNNKPTASNTSQHASKRNKPPTPAPLSSTAVPTRTATATSAKPKPKPKHTPSHGRSHPSNTAPRTKQAASTTSSSSSSSKATRRSTTPTGPSLRTAARRFKRPAPSPKPGESDEHHRARTNHNLVEQQYRHRLHAKFEDLLDALPDWIPLLDGEEEAEEDEDDDDMEGGAAAAVGGRGPVGGGGGGGVGKAKGDKNRRMSKVDVLSRAARVIRHMESELEGRRSELEGRRTEVVGLKMELEKLRKLCELQGKQLAQLQGKR